MTREVTCKLLEMMDAGELSADAVARACLNYMSEYDVKEMAESEGLIDIEDEDK